MKKENIIDSFVSISHIKDHKENKFKTVKKISFNDIFKMSQNIEYFQKTNEFKLIFESKNLTKVFYSFLKRNSIFFVPKAVAAASSQMNVREFDGGKLTINKSNKNNEIIYINIILNEIIDKSIKKLYVGKEDVFESLDLLEFIDNQTQVMIKHTDRIYKLIIDPNVEIFIR